MSNVTTNKNAKGPFEAQLPNRGSPSPTIDGDNSRSIQMGMPSNSARREQEVSPFGAQVSKRSQGAPASQRYNQDDDKPLHSTRPSVDENGNPNDSKSSNSR